VLDYIHHNPVKGKWNLVEDYTLYPYSSAGYFIPSESLAEDSEVPQSSHSD
jgi:hypothetical protein